ncbi:MAG TPA: hypothetical protein VMN03_05235 [Burkholderiales bacterium]|nr:hypothetical protein [Burkholderiales bacterium]
MADRALWISWYDLPDEGRDAYLQWAHGAYIPALIKRPGILWGAHFKTEASVPMSGVPRGAHGRLRHTDDPAVPRGNAYILIFGGESAHAFAHPTPRKLHAGLSEEDRKMLARRAGERVNIFTDENGIGGPEAGKRDPKQALSPCIQLGSFGAGSADEDEILDWYANWRLPSMNRLPGCVGIRKLVSVSGWAKHGVLYEFVSLAARNEHFPDHEKATPEMDAWTDRLVRQLLHAPGSPCVAQRLFSAVR